MPRKFPGHNTFYQKTVMWQNIVGDFSIHRNIYTNEYYSAN